MTFYGKEPQPGPRENEPLRTFWYTHKDYLYSQSVAAHRVYFYESGHVGFWVDEGDDSRLVLAVKANRVWEGKS